MIFVYFLRPKAKSVYTEQTIIGRNIRELRKDENAVPGRGDIPNFLSGKVAIVGWALGRVIDLLDQFF